MNTITQIENSLKAINEASFQSLITHLLYLQGNKFIGAPGAVAGKDKASKGAPDVFFINFDKYIFVECTTKEKLGFCKSFVDKLLKDIDHCFNESATGIKKEYIEKVILACTEKVSPKEHKQLTKKVQYYNPGAALEIFTIQNLPLTLYEFPLLTKEYLNVEVIKGDIFNLEEFLIKTTRGLQPSLTNEFIAREEELKKCIDTLRHSDILLLSGAAGVGKSKLAVKVLEEFSKENYVPIVIQSWAVPLFEDFQKLFQPGKHYIILFDDANKSITNLNYLLSAIEKSKPYTIKLIITVRDYVKKQVEAALSNYAYTEILIADFKDQEIGEIMLTVLPTLKHYPDIKRKIVELAKGNARLALMATNSVIPNAGTNYLNSPVLLYEKYFKKISEEIGVFNKPVILKSLAIISFFGVADRNNDELKANLEKYFNIDWNELWSAIMELHRYELVDVYSNELAKISDQVLATYAFYKCFIDDTSAVINYAEWIKVFIEKYARRIKTTLIDVNNTFRYDHVREQVVPHLNDVLKSTISDNQLYCFYSLFWFYKDRECLLYLSEWIHTLEFQNTAETAGFGFTYNHNSHTTASRYFELLKNYWGQPNELLKSSLELTLELVVKQPSRLPEILKFIHDEFKYKWNDVESKFSRQHTLMNVLLNEWLTGSAKFFANGIFLNVAEALLGWHYTEYACGRGMTFTLYNFNLFKSPELLALRSRILEGTYNLFDNNNEQAQKILQQIVFPGGDIDKTIYIEEHAIYERIISEKLDANQYAHCEFIKRLAKHVTAAGGTCPDTWDRFTRSKIMRLSEFLKPGWEYHDGKSIKAFEKEKKEEFDSYVKLKDWDSIEKLLLAISDLYCQQTPTSNWRIQPAVADIYTSLAKKDKNQFESALRLYFSSTVRFPLSTTVVNFALHNKIITGNELLSIINDYEFAEKNFWITALLTALPDEEVTDSFFNLLIETFAERRNNIYIFRMLDYLKYEKVFEAYKCANPELQGHNIITYLTSIILQKPEKQIKDFGYHFCEDCAFYFTNNLALLKKAYLVQKEVDEHFDYDGKELEAVLKMDSSFFVEHLEQKIVDFKYLSFKLENFKLDYIWALPEYEEIINKCLNIIVAKCPVYSNWDHPAMALFIFQKQSDELYNKSLAVLNKYLRPNCFDKQRVLMVMSIVVRQFKNEFVVFLKEFLLVNKNLEVFKSIHFNKGGAYTGSRIPHIQQEINLCKEVLAMIKTLPDILSYTKHIDYIEAEITYLKKDIIREQREEFEEEHY